MRLTLQIAIVDNNCMSNLPNAAEEWLTLQEAANHAKSSKGTVRKWIGEGLRTLRAGKGPGGGKHLIARSDLDAFLRRKLEEQQAQAAEAAANGEAA